MRNLSKALISLLFAAALPACDRKSAPPPAQKSAAPDSQVFTVKGVVRELEPDGKTAVIQHEAISNYMPSMIMPFEVRDTNLLRGIQVGDSIRFQLVVTPKAGWIDAITRLQSDNSPAAAPPPPGLHFSRALPPLDEGDMLPEYHFTNELGQAVSLSQFRGRVLAFTFFFTSCPYPDFCPRMTANFAEVAKTLEAMTNAPASWQLLSISFDPASDTPSRLTTYALAAHYDPGHWSFLTGEQDQVEGLSDQIGERFWREGASIGHNLRTVVIDPRGRIRKIFVGNKWTPAEMVKEMVQAGKKAADPAVH
jgi:protein SCO1